MAYESVDALQKALSRDVFHYAADAKKAAGRALGTLVEIITFYLIKSWGFETHTAIERQLPEYANPDITHNVEFSLHPSYELTTFRVPSSELPLTASKLVKRMGDLGRTMRPVKTNQLLSSDETLRNACVLYEDSSRLVVAYLGRATTAGYPVRIHQLNPHPFAVLECKRVGVEEGNRKGPQTIEKAKQGAYVARSVSSLQKIRMSNGDIFGIMETDGGALRYEPYEDLLRKVIASDDSTLLRNFTLTVGVASNHGNWFTSQDQNKELKVLAQSYDWLIFLTDDGLSEFVHSLLIDPCPEYKPVRDAFVASYTGAPGGNRFTKVKIALAADIVLQNYFASRLGDVEGWFNVISPVGRSLAELRDELVGLASKDWRSILS